MGRIARCLWLLCLAALAHAAQTPFLFEETHVKQPKIAVIGAGASGSFATYSLAHFLPLQFDYVRPDVHLFEANNYVGGRSTILHLPQGNAYAELGASIFVAANKNMMKAAQVFNLTLQNGHGEGETLEKKPMAIWNGDKYVFQESSSQYWDLVKLVWKYGYTSPLTARKLVRQAVSAFVNLYSPTSISKGPFSMQDYVKMLNFTAELSQPAFSYYAKAGIKKEFINDIVSAATSVNYAQSTLEISSVGGLVSLAATGASSIVDGNRQIFEQFISRAKSADVHLSTRVKSLAKLDGKNPQWRLLYETGEGSKSADLFDAVIIATPHSLSDIELINTDAASLIAPISYVDLHVTLVLTNASAPQACFFNSLWSCEEKAPNSIYTALDGFDMGQSRSKPLINSLNYLKEVGPGLFAVKMFSRQTLSPLELERIFGTNNVFWTYEKIWNAYPNLTPMDATRLPPVVLDDGLYYPSAFDALISTMETATVSSWNVVAHIMQDFYDIQLNKSWAEWDE